MAEKSFSNQSGGSALGRFFRGLLRLIFVLIVGALVGLGLYYGVPWIYQTLVRPVQQHEAAIAALEQQVDQEHERLQEENQALQERVADLETELTELRETTAVQTQDLSAAEEQAGTLESRLVQIEEKLDEQQETLRALQTGLGEQTAAAAGQYEYLEAWAYRVNRQIVFTQMAQDLLKVRLMLLEENPRAAQDALALAVEHLDRVTADSGEFGQELAGFRERMVALDPLIADRSFRVTSDLEALWADVMDLALLAETPEAAVEAAGTPTAGPFPTRTPYLTPTPYPTPTPFLSPLPTPKPTS